MAPKSVRAAGDLLTGNREVIEESESVLSQTDLAHIDVRLKNEETPPNHSDHLGGSHGSDYFVEGYPYPHTDA